MKKAVWVVILLIVAVGASGCFVSVKGDGCPHKKNIHHPEIDSAIAEIDAVKMLGSDSARQNVLEAIAARPGLSPEARLHLVDSVKMLGSESSREGVLMTLADNPPVHPAPKPCGKKAD